MSQKVEFCTKTKKEVFYITYCSVLIGITLYIICLFSFEPISSKMISELEKATV